MVDRFAGPPPEAPDILKKLAAGAIVTVEARESLERLTVRSK